MNITDHQDETLIDIKNMLPRAELMQMFVLLTELGGNIIQPRGSLRKIEKLSNLLHNAPEKIEPVDLGYEAEFEDKSLDYILNELIDEMHNYSNELNKAATKLDTVLKRYKNNKH